MSLALRSDHPYRSYMTQSSQPGHAPLLVEIRYFAAPRDDWELLLLRTRQLGIGTIAARVPWAWHAPADGAFDLDGTTDERRDLIGFVKLCGRLGLQVLVHPGPLHSNLLGGGAPAWLLQQQLAACARDQDGAPWRDAGDLPLPSALHPAFLAASRDWIAAFSAAMRALQAPTGPIVALHAGNSSTPDRLDYNQAATTHPDAPDLLPETLSTFAAWYANTAAEMTSGWLRADGWRVEVRPGQLFRKPPDHQASAPVAALATPGEALMLELPGTRHPLLAATLPTTDWLLRTDGSPRLDFWRVKMNSLLIATAESDIANASTPADLALADTRAPHYPAPARAAGTALAQRLQQASVAFDMLDLEAATPQDLARYALIILPGTLDLSPSAQQKLAQCANIVLLSDQADIAGVRDLEDDLSRSHDLPTSPAPQLPIDISADQLAELIEQRGGIARYAWADGANVDLAVRYGANHTYLALDNRRPAPYNGILAYRGRDGAVLHLHAGIGARRAGMVLLTDDEVYGAAIDGDAAEGGWLARGLRSSAMFNSGAGALARCGAGLLLTAPQGGRFQARRAEGWAGMRAYRLLLSGALVPAHVQIDAAHIAIAYVAEDPRGQTDMYIILPEGDMPPLVRNYLAALLAARIAMLGRAAALAEGAPEQLDQIERIAQIVAPFTAAAAHLAAAADRFATPDEYGATWAAADERCQPALSALAQALTQARGALLAGRLDPAAHEAIERRIARIVGLATRANAR
jgi:hypothetical protein